MKWTEEEKRIDFRILSNVPTLVDDEFSLKAKYPPFCHAACLPPRQIMIQQQSPQRASERTFAIYIIILHDDVISIHATFIHPVSFSRLSVPSGVRGNNL